MPFDVKSIKWKINEYRDFKKISIRRSLLRDIISEDYKRDSFNIYNSIGREMALKMGIKFSDSAPGNLLREVYFEKIYDKPGFIPSKGDRIIDVGASVGDTAIYWARMYGARVIAFEPLSELYEIMRANIYLNVLDELITTYNLALGDGTDINFDVDGYMMKNSPNSLKRIKTEKLDNFDFRDISMIKIDVEGFEIHVLKGAIETIKLNKPKIIIETHSKELRKKTHELLSSIGYSLIYKDRSRRGNGFMDEVTNLFYK